MACSVRKAVCIGATAAALSGVGAAVATIVPSGRAGADTCTNEVGNNLSVSYCADLTDIVGAILTPGPVDRGPGNMTPNASTCLSWDGRWVESNTCQ